MSEIYKGPVLEGPPKGQIIESSKKNFIWPMIDHAGGEIREYHLEWDEDAKGWRLKAFNRRKLTP